MNVEALIQELQKMPQDATVIASIRDVGEVKKVADVSEHWFEAGNILPPVVMIS